MDAVVTITGFPQEKTAKASGKTFYVVPTSLGDMSTFNEGVANAAAPFNGKNVLVDYNVTEKGDKTYLNLYGVKGESDQPAESAPAPSSAAGPGPGVRSGGGGGAAKREEPFKKDPIGILVNIREKALGCAIAAFPQSQPPDHAGILTLAKIFELHLFEKLGGIVEIPPYVVLRQQQPGPAAPPAPTPPPAAPAAGPTEHLRAPADDDIPF